MKPDSDCLIIGGGPAGLTAAIYLSRFHLRVVVVDDGNSRALWIACTHNHAGFPDGVSGEALLERMRIQAVQYGSIIVSGRVTRLETGADGFDAEWGEGIHCTKTVLLATGVKNRRPSIDEVLHETALRDGYIRYCPVCDGYEVTDKRLGVIGTGERGVNEAVFLRSYSADVTLIAPDGPHELDEAANSRIAECGIGLVDGPAHVSGIADDQIIVQAGTSRQHFDSVYPALGSDNNSDLAIAMGVETSDVGCIKVDTHQRTSIDGIYAAGDVVLGLDQISHAMGEAGVAATAIRNDLAKIATLLR